MRWIRLALLVCFALLLRDTRTPLEYVPPPEPSPPHACEPGAPEFTAVTYNVGLAPGMVHYASPRSPHVAAAVAGLDFDALCLQEVWLDRDQRAIIEALRVPAGHVLTMDTEGFGESPDDACEDEHLAPVLACVRERCGDAPTEETTLCALDHCRDELTSLYLWHGKCLNCLAASVGLSADEIAAACTGGNRASRVYGGRNGVMLMSRFPLERRETLLLPSSGGNRVALFARINVPDIGPVELACTHISSPQRIPPMHSGYGTWQEEQSAQLRQISDRLAARAVGMPALFFGDMNFGQENGDAVSASSREVWVEANRLGFQSPAAFAEPPLCSACGDNALRGYPSTGYLLDHVMIRNPQSSPALVACGSRRLLDGPASVRGYDGELITTHLSDHFAISVTFGLR